MMANPAKVNALETIQSQRRMRARVTESLQIAFALSIMRP